MHNKVDTSLNFVDRERAITEFWKKNKIFEKSTAKNEGGKDFVFFDGPPTANGKPHIGHILTRVMKDIIPRYQTMKGCHIERKAGWDTHGLPVELEVEKLLGINGKPQIEEYGIEPFIEKCKESVWKYTSEWERMSDSVGYWVDMEDPYITYNDNYIESEWWALKTIADKGLLYKGHKVVPYCPRCGTALSSHEVAQGYKDVKETSVFVSFPVKGEKDLYLLAWTTTPWTLPSNVALCVNAAEDYVYAAHEGKTYILAKALLSVLGEDAEVVKEVKGSELCGMDYEPLFDFAKDVKKRAWYVVADSYVTLDSGSGIVHIAPAFGEDDARVGRDNDLPFVQMVDNQGKFIPEAAPYEGLFVKDADRPIIEDLKAKGLLFAELPYEHSYPFCWRCDTPLLYYARSTWFIRMTAMRDKLVENNRKINWMPETIKEGRMGNFLENVIDWALSRERYWGTPLPVWECDCGHFHVVGSREELNKLTGAPLDTELHKPYLDPLTMKCEKCGGTMHRAPEVIDCWFDSGSMPFAQWHYPFENHDKFSHNFPADFISEAIDQTRGWFYSLLAISTLLFDCPPFKNCIVLGHVGDKDGVKMSKHKGNVVDPFSVLDVQGADAVRWYFYTASAPWLPSRFYAEAVSEAQRKFMGTLWNTYAFYVLYANIDNFDPTAYKLEPEKLSLMDKWILSKLNSLVDYVDKSLANYVITEPARAMQAFVDELSNWYVRRCRERYWGSEMTQDKINAYMTLYTVLTTLAKISAPFVPFMAEELYQNLVCNVDASAPESVHLCTFPECEPSLIDKALEDNMELLLEAVVLGRACRAGANIKNRQPLKTLLIRSERILPAEFNDLIADELNIKSVEFLSDAGEYTNYVLKPQMRTLGPKYGKLLGKIGQFLKDCDAASVVATVKKGEAYRTVIDGTEIELFESDLLISSTNREGFVAESDGKIVVILDVQITDELRKEGYVREIISKVQTMRKDIGLEVTDHIILTVTAEGELLDAAKDGAAQIGAGAQADEVLFGAPADNAKEWDINGKKCTLSVKKA